MLFQVVKYSFYATQVRSYLEKLTNWNINNNVTGEER